MLSGKRIKERRLQLGMTVMDLADKLGKNRATVYRYESDEIEEFPLSIIEPLADALLTSPAYLMGWTDDPSPAAKRPADKSEPGLDEVKHLFESLNDENQKRLLDFAQVLLTAQRADAGPKEPEQPEG